jgi:hypothetical protein
MITIDWKISTIIYLYIVMIQSFFFQRELLQSDKSITFSHNATSQHKIQATLKTKKILLACFGDS